LPLIGVQFLRSGRWGKLICLVAGVFTANAVILTRSRGAVVGLAAGALIAVIFSPPNKRLLIIGCLAVVMVGGFCLADIQFLTRASTIDRPEEERDSSAQSRIRLAQAGTQMLSDHPFGVGAGNFYQTIGRYIPEYEGKDAHNTYVRCFTELGVQGGIVFLFLIGNAVFMLFRIRKNAILLPEYHRDDVIYFSYGLLMAISVLFTCCLTISLTYVEFLWWVLALPVCLDRVVQNLQTEFVASPEALLDESKLQLSDSRWMDGHVVE
jgi:putative inorganic carbon (hco3(-)) transporter